MHSFVRCARYGLGLAASFALPAAAQAAWKIDPDFRPLVHLRNTLPPITTVLPDGRFIVNEGTQRLLADGSLDPDYHSSVPYDRVLVSPTGQLIAGTRPLVWLAADGRPSGVSVNSTTEATIDARFLRMNVAGFRPNGSFVVYGAFQALNGVPRTGIARILPDGSIDPAFVPADLAAIVAPSNPDPDFWRDVRAALQSDGKVVILAHVGASFGTVRLFRLNTDGAIDLTFEPGADFASVGQGRLVVDALDRIITYRQGGSGSDLWRQDPNGTNPVVVEASTTASELWPEPDGSVFIRKQVGFARLHADGTVTPVIPAPGAGGIFAVAHGYLHSQSSNRIYHRLLPDGSVDPTLTLSGAAPSFAAVQSLAPAPENRVVVGGYFSHVDGVAQPQLARLNADGSLDPTFDPVIMPSGAIRTVAAQSDGKILVGGSFAVTTLASRSGIVRYNVDGSLDESFNAGLPGDDTEVRAIAALTDGRIVIAGAFSTVGGIARPGLARLLSTGALDTTFVPPDAAYFSIEVLPDEKLLLAVIIPTGVSRSGAMRLNSDGSLDAQFLTPEDEGWSFTTSASMSPDGSVAVVGSIGSGIARTKLYSFDAGGTPGVSQEFLHATGLNPFNAVLRDTGGSIVTVNRGGRYALERYDDSGAIDPSFAIELEGGDARHLTYDDQGRILVAGQFVGVDGMMYSGALRLVRDDTPPPRLTNVSTRGFVGSGDDVLIGGFYIGGTERQRVLIRGVAENLVPFGVTGLATDVRLAVYRNGVDRPVHESDSWTGVQDEPYSIRTHYVSERTGAFPLEIFRFPAAGKNPPTRPPCSNSNPAATPYTSAPRARVSD